MKPGKSYELIQELTKTLRATHSPATKDGVAYHLMVFHTPDPDLWVASLIPITLVLLPAQVLNTVNSSYSSFRDGQPSTTGILFFENPDSAHLISQVAHWYNEHTADQNPRTPEVTYCN